MLEVVGIQIGILYDLIWKAVSSNTFVDRTKHWRKGYACRLVIKSFFQSKLITNDARLGQRNKERKLHPPKIFTWENLTLKMIKMKLEHFASMNLKNKSKVKEKY